MCYLSLEQLYETNERVGNTFVIEEANIHLVSTYA